MTRAYKREYRYLQTFWGDFVKSYICCDIKLTFLIDSAGRYLFRKLCLPWQTVHYSLPAVRKCNNLRDHCHPYEWTRGCRLPNSQPWPNSIDYKIWGNMSIRQKRSMWTIWGSIWLMCELEWNRALSVMALTMTSDADASMPTFELQENILTIHCSIY